MAPHLAQVFTLAEVGGGGEAFSGLPHREQKFSPGLTALPHFLQKTMSFHDRTVEFYEFMLFGI